MVAHWSSGQDTGLRRGWVSEINEVFQAAGAICVDFAIVEC